MISTLGRATIFRHKPTLFCSKISVSQRLILNTEKIDIKSFAIKSKTQGFFYASDGSIYSFSILKSDPEDSRSDIRQVKLEKLHNIHQSNLKNQSYGVDNVYLFEPELVYVPTLKGCLLYDSY